LKQLFFAVNPLSLLNPHKDFLRMLKEDIISYGTLSDYTLRRFSNFKENILDDLLQLKNELGEDYLVKEKNRRKDINRELIIAINNIKG
jgi:hypothetical protein